MKGLSLELCDVVDKSGIPTGRTVQRGSRLAVGEYYLVVHVWIQDEAGAYLIQQRAHDRATDPGVWATTAGQVRAGEDSLSGAIRETSEELGLPLLPTQLRLLSRNVMATRVEDIWLATVTRLLFGSPQPGFEVADWKWVSRAALIDLANRGEFFRYSYLADLPQ